MTQKTITKRELDNKLDIARQAQGIAHLLSFGLVLSTWDFSDPELIKRAENILQSEQVSYNAIEQVCQALFWYKDTNNELHLHFWE